MKGVKFAYLSSKQTAFSSSQNNLARNPKLLIDNKKPSNTKISHKVSYSQGLETKQMWIFLFVIICLQLSIASVDILNDSNMLTVDES